MEDNKDEVNLIKESFISHIRNEGIDSRSIDAIILKGKKIIEKIDQITSNIDKKALLIGKVQSGKTVNFMSVIVNAFLNNYNFVFVLTAIDTKLHDQTIKRIKDSFDIEKNKNFLKIYDINDTKTKNLFKKLEDGRERILKDNKKGKFIIFALLKNPANLRAIKDIFNEDSLRNIKTLIIDDEGDLASLSRSKAMEKKTLISIKEFVDMFTNASYISVTATPQVQYLMKKDDEMIPRKVFCIEPGNGYAGLDIFDSEKYYESVEKEKKSNLLYDALLYYMISWANILHEDDVIKWKTRHIENYMKRQEYLVMI